MKKVQLEKSTIWKIATWSNCNIKQNERMCNMKKVTRVKYSKKNAKE